MKLGNGSETRITQACDRCRKKKIKCDGIRPCCLQCTNAGLECRTSDVLSRRAISRNYTKSLEERVRSLEMEVRDLKSLLDQKDERIDMLSKISPNGWPSHCASSSTPGLDSSHGPANVHGDAFRIQSSPLLFKSENSEPYFMGASSGAGFICVLKQKIQEIGYSYTAINAEAFLNTQSHCFNELRSDSSNSPFIPPRHFSDRCVAVFWQEWAPLFPILNMVNFLGLYGEYVKNPQKITNHYKLTQLHLVFSIAALSSKVSDQSHIAMCNQQWQRSIDVVLGGSTLMALQCLVLASLLSFLKGDYIRLQQYKGVAVGLSFRLGLHQSQKNFPFCAITLETRKRAFWALYTVDRFSAATVGLPTLLKEEDIQCEFPTYTEDMGFAKGHPSTAPSKFTKTTGASALLQVTRILSRVLEQNYSTNVSYALTIQSISLLNSDLNDWYTSLPKHLTLTTAQGKPSPDTISSQSATLCVVFHYIRSLIYLPTIGSTLGSKAASFVDSMADSSKYIIQIMQLMEEHNLPFSICLDRHKILTMCGLSLLYQHLDLEQEGQSSENDLRLIGATIELLEKANTPGVLEFKRLATLIMSSDRSHNPSFSSADGHIPAPPKIESTPPPFPYSLSEQQTHQPSIYSMTYSSEMDLRERQHIESPVTTFSEPLYSHSNASYNSSCSVMSESPKSCPSLTSVLPTSHMVFNSTVGLNNFDFSPPSNNMLVYQPRFQVPMCTSASQEELLIHSLHSLQDSKPTTVVTTAADMQSSGMMADMESLLSDIDGNESTIYDAVYNSWPNNGWDVTTLNMHGFTAGGLAQTNLGFNKNTPNNGGNREMFNFGK